jgi:hypothetical protein
MQMKLFRLSEDVPLVVVVVLVVVLVPSFFLANGFLICSRTRARRQTHPKARKANGSSQEEDS